MKLSRSQIAVLAAFAGTSILWGVLLKLGLKDGNYNYLYSFLFGLIPLFGGLIAMVGSRLWGGLRSAMGKAVFFLGLGLLLWGAGETVWSYYNFVIGEAAPYPSVADIGFGPSIFFWIVGVVYLSRASGAKFGLRSRLAKGLTVLLTLGLTALSYYLLVVVARGGVVTTGGNNVKVILDIIYPLGDLLAAIVGVLVYVLSRKYLGGQYKVPILFILAGLVIMYVGDFNFSYTTTVGTYYNADWGDLVLATGLSCLTFGALGLCARPGRAKS